VIWPKVEICYACRIVGRCRIITDRLESSKSVASAAIRTNVEYTVGSDCATEVVVLLTILVTGITIRRGFVLIEVRDMFTLTISNN
jgi:hypothetical protein